MSVPPFVQASKTCTFTADEVMTKYEAGQFRVIPTEGKYLQATRDGDYVLASLDGLYRVGDGAFFDYFESPRFSPDERYLEQNDGIYRLEDLQQVVPIRKERIVVFNGEHAVFTGLVQFSKNSEYVSITGAGQYRAEAKSQSTEGYGVFRLRDGQQILASDSFEMTFSSDSLYVALDEGIFRLSDGYHLAQIPGTGSFSPDGKYVFNQHGTFRTNDGQRVLATTGAVYFTPDMMYAVVPSDGVFRLSDGQRLYALDYDRVYTTYPLFSADSQYVAMPDYYPEHTESERILVYRIANGALLLDFMLSNANTIRFSPDSTMIAIAGDGIYRLSDQKKLVDNTDQDWSGSEFSHDSAYVIAYYDGIYRIANGQKLFDIENRDSVTIFSQDSEYVAISNDGLYRLSDQQKLFDIQGYVGDFVPNEDYFTGFTFDVSNEPAVFSIYRISDGKRFENINFLNVQCGILASGNDILIVNPTL